MYININNHSHFILSHSPHALSMLGLNFDMNRTPLSSELGESVKDSLEEDIELMQHVLDLPEESYSTISLLIHLIVLPVMNLSLQSFIKVFTKVSHMSFKQHIVC